MSAPAEKPQAAPQGKAEGKAFKLIEKSGMDLEALEVEGEQGQAGGAMPQEAAAAGAPTSQGEKREIQEREANR
ncbi:hypothetical protein C2E21_1725 [Chlorella sorokiniana]|uniref:Uncharacterized protein n=1 Tax=Chlorella sorokiniana TaxID=3076 RepID=A0A2P6TZY1_CHLSO|nr:hypothetical protein C2E21_1725 [Chlorella sorokiniana]|eukprot:PRW59622.1 hypothetical protein C2E21_1725 [Chlorella sorokiniana]